MHNDQKLLDVCGVIPYGLREQQVESLGNKELLDKLSVIVKDCKKCSLHQTRTQTVFGVGSVNPELLVVGEAPGYYEDKKGEPFVGRAGGLLNLMLSAINLNRKDVYIANVIKCRPENNRDPKKEEIASCTPYLLEQVEILSPKIILALGRHAAHFLLNCSESLSNLRRQEHVFPKTNIPLIVTYHPAYLLRNPKDKANSFRDLLKIKKIIAS